MSSESDPNCATQFGDLKVHNHSAQSVEEASLVNITHIHQHEECEDQIVARLLTKTLCHYTKGTQ